MNALFHSICSILNIFVIFQIILLPVNETLADSTHLSPKSRFQEDASIDSLKSSYQIADDFCKHFLDRYLPLDEKKRDFKLFVPGGSKKIFQIMNNSYIEWYIFVDEKNQKIALINKQTSEFIKTDIPYSKLISILKRIDFDKGIYKLGMQFFFITSSCFSLLGKLFSPNDFSFINFDYWQIGAYIVSSIALFAGFHRNYYHKFSILFSVLALGSYMVPSVSFLIPFFLTLASILFVTGVNTNIFLQTGLAMILSSSLLLFLDSTYAPATLLLAGGLISFTLNLFYIDTIKTIIDDLFNSYFSNLKKLGTKTLIFVLAGMFFPLTSPIIALVSLFLTALGLVWTFEEHEIQVEFSNKYNLAAKDLYYMHLKKVDKDEISGKMKELINLYKRLSSQILKTTKTSFIHKRAQCSISA
ncbi:MAG: hypothetical protein ACD_79C00070G0002 [uncultured bacterium]|nr:MAG: hypothetical protein ACD_79C00070G0002 [uncultured bacterium]